MRNLFLMAVLFFQLQPAAPPGGVIFGRLIESDRTPVSRILVVVQPANPGPIQFGPFYRASFTDQSGAFRFNRTGIPDPFFIRYLNYGSARLLSEPMVVSSAERADLQIGFGTKTPNPWVKVSGQVTGMSSSHGPYRVALEGDLLATMETLVNSDGTFEFPMVLTGEEYTASIVPPNPAAHAARVRAAMKDVNDVKIVIPPEREITVRAAVEGGGPVPGFLLKLESGPCNPYCAGTMSVAVKPDRDGIFKVNLPEDERRIYVDGLPIGYSLQSIAYGSTVLTSGQPGEERSTRSLKLGGSFSFSKLPQGTYTPALTVDGVSGALDPSSIAVTGKELIGIQIAAPRRNARSARPDRPVVEPASMGTEISELGRASNDGDNYSAAVANVRTINTAQVTYLASSGGNYGTLKDLVDAGLLDESFLSIKAGYHFSTVATGFEYIATAVPAAGGGRFGVYSTPDAVVRHSLAPILSPKGQEGQPLR